MNSILLVEYHTHPLTQVVLTTLCCLNPALTRAVLTSCWHRGVVRARAPDAFPVIRSLTHRNWISTRTQLKLVLSRHR